MPVLLRPCVHATHTHAHAQVNVVVMRGVNDDEVADFVELTRNDPVNVRCPGS